MRDRYLGRKNSVVAVLDAADRRAPPPAEKKNIGRYANELKQAIDARWTVYEEAARDAAPVAGGVDVTLPGRRPLLGHRHPLTVVRDRMEEIFTRMGFAIVEGPEVEDEWHCFDALNMLADHPARDMQDTLYLASPIPGERRRRRCADDAADAHLVDADPLHAGASAADPHRRARPRLSARRSRSDAHAGVLRRSKGWWSAKGSRSPT